MRRNKWMAIGGSVAALGLAAVALWFAFAAPLIAETHRATGYMAKSVCSCLFVEKRGLAGCRADALVDRAEPLAHADLRVSEHDKWVKASLFPFVSDTAAYEEGYGCALK